MAVSARSKLLSTPIADLVRGRVTGAASYKVLLAEVGLPSDLEGYARRVVKKTRLRRRERIQAAETVAVTLLENLGTEPDVAAVLARQPKPGRWAKDLTREIVSQRGYFGRAWAFLKRKIAVTMAVLLVIYAVQFYRFYFQYPKMTRNYAAEFNATIANVPDSDRAWDLLRQMGPITPDTGHPLDKLWPDVAEGDEAWATYVEFVHDHKAQLGMIREASKRPVLGFYVTMDEIEEESPQVFKPQLKPDPTEDVFRLAWLMPYLGKSRACARLLKADMRVAAAEGDGVRVCDDVLAMLRLAERLRKPTENISDLVAVAMIVLASDTMAEVLHSHPGIMDDVQLGLLADEFSKIDCGSWLEPMMSSEIEKVNDIVQRAWTDDGNGDGHFCGRGMEMFNALARSQTTVFDTLGGPVSIDWMASRKEMMAAATEMARLHIQYGRLPTWERGEDPGVALAQVYDSEREGLRHVHVGMFFGEAIVKSIGVLSGGDMNRDRARVVIAMERFRLRHAGAYPARLEDLVPGLLKRVPLDAFDGHPLRYKVTDDGPLLYSVGNNEQDDGGVRSSKAYEAAFFTQPGMGRTAVDGDWILWPPVSALQHP